MDRLVGGSLSAPTAGTWLKMHNQISVYSTGNRNKEIIEQFDLNEGYREPFAFIDGQKAQIGLTEGGILVVDLKSGTREPSGLGNEHLFADYNYYQVFAAGNAGEKALLLTSGYCVLLYLLTPAMMMFHGNMSLGVAGIL